MDYTKNTIKQLRNIAKQRGMVGYSRLRKPALVTVITAYKPSLGDEYKAQTVKQLRNIAKQRYVKGYTRLRKADLIAKITKKSVHDEATSLIYERTKFEINELVKWIEGFEHVVPKKELTPRVEAIKAEVKSIAQQYVKDKFNFKIEHTASAIKGFTNQHTIQGADGIDAATFFNITRPQVVDSLTRNRQTKINMVLTCTMARVDMKTGEVTSGDFPFVSKT